MAQNPVAPQVVQAITPFNQVLQNTFQGVAANALVSANIAVGATYYGMQLSVPGATAAQIAAGITNVLINVDGEILMNLSAADIQTVNGFEGFTNRDGVLNLPIVPRYFRDFKDTLAAGLGLGRAANAFVQVQLAGTITGITSIALVTSANPDARPLGAHRRLLASPLPVPGAGTFTQDVQRNAAALVKNIHFCNGALVTNTTLRVNTNTVRNNLPVALVNDACNRAGYLPQANTPTFNLDEFQAGVAGLPLVGVTDLQVAATASGTIAGGLRVVTDYLWDFAGANGLM